MLEQKLILASSGYNQIRVGFMGVWLGARSCPLPHPRVLLSLLVVVGFYRLCCRGLSSAPALGARHRFPIVTSCIMLFPHVAVVNDRHLKGR